MVIPETNNNKTSIHMYKCLFDHTNGRTEEKFYFCFDFENRQQRCCPPSPNQITKSYPHSSIAPFSDRSNMEFTSFDSYFFLCDAGRVGGDGQRLLLHAPAYYMDIPNTMYRWVCVHSNTASPRQLHLGIMMLLHWIFPKLVSQSKNFYIKDE